MTDRPWPLGWKDVVIDGRKVSIYHDYPRHYYALDPATRRVESRTTYRALVTYLRRRKRPSPPPFSVVMRVDREGRCARCGCPPGDHYAADQPDLEPGQESYGIWTRCRNHEGLRHGCFYGE